MNRSILSILSLCISLIGCLTLWMWEFYLSCLCDLCPDRTLTPVLHLIFFLIFLGISFGLNFIITNFKKSLYNEQKLRRIEAHLQEIQRISKIGTWEFIPSTDQVYWSDEMFRVFGLNPQKREPNFNEFLQLIHPEDRNAVNRVIEQGITEGIPFEIEHRIIHPDGSIRYLEAKGDVYQAPGEVMRMFGTVRDISERKETEIALKESNAYYQSLADVLPQCLYRKDLEGRLTFGNRAFLETLGKPLEEVLGITVDDVYPPELAEKYKADDQRVIETGQVLDLIEEHKAPINDETIYVQVVKTPVRDEAGKIIATQGIFWNITDRQHLELALKESEQRLRSILESSPYGIFIKDLHGYYTYVNPAYEQMSHLTREELLGKSDYDILPNEFAQTCEASDQTVITEKRSILFEEEVPFDASKSTLLVTKFPLLNTVDQCYAICGIVLDISDRKRAELARIDSEAQLNRVISSAAASIICLRIYADQTWDCEYFSAGSEAIYGYSAEEFMAVPSLWMSRIHPDDIVNVMQSILTQTLTGETSEHEFQFYHKDGSLHWIRSTVNSQLDPENQSGLATIVNVDITQRKRTEEALQNSEALLKKVQQMSKVGGWEINWKTQHCFWTEEVYRIHELPLDFEPPFNRDHTKVSLDYLNRFYIPEEREILEAAFLNCSQFGEAYDLELQLITAKGNHRWVRVTGNAILEENQVMRMVGYVMDITERKQAELALQQQTHQEKAFNRVVQLIRNCLDLENIFSIAVQEAAQLINIKQVAVVQYQSESEVWITLASYSHDSNKPDIKGCQIPDQNNPFSAQLKRGEIVRMDDTNIINDPIIFAVKQDFSDSGLLIPLVVSGKVWGSLSLLGNMALSPDQNEQVTLACRFADQLAIAIQQSQLYQQLEQVNKQLHHLANHDQLTQIANRRYFDEYLEQEWKRSARDQTPLVLILCDVDYFKRYNDTYGHPAGDQCLFEIAQTLYQTIRRPGDFVARYGGEEFVIILPNTDEQGAIHIIHKIQEKIKALNIPHCDSLVDQRITLSFGIACADSTSKFLVEHLIKTADQALYQTKQRERNSYSIQFVR